MLYTEKQTDTTLARHFVWHTNLLLSSQLPRQALLPSFQVCSNFESPGLPHFWNHAPPRPQQLSLPDLLVPHLGHAVLARDIAGRAVVTAGERQALRNSTSSNDILAHRARTSSIYLCRPARPQTKCVRTLSRPDHRSSGTTHRHEHSN